LPIYLLAILRKLAGGDVTLSPAALQALRAYDFPGNVRELENILERHSRLPMMVVFKWPIWPYAIIKTTNGTAC
jgi:transcriptional regulator with PAS, ATPase and Fis domain